MADRLRGRVAAEAGKIILSMPFLFPRYFCRLFSGLWLILWPGVMIAASLLESDEPGLGVWDFSSSLRLSSGYKDNVELSSVRPIGSALARAEVDFMLWRLPDQQYEVLLFGTAEYTRMLTQRTVEKNESMAFGEIEFRWTPVTDWRFSAGAGVFFIDQFFDFSVSDVQRTVAKLLSTGGSVHLAGRREFSKGRWLELQPRIKRDTYRDRSDDAWQLSGRLAVGVEPIRRLALTLAAEVSRRGYDHREQLSLRGSPLAGTRLAFIQRELELRAMWTGDGKMEGQRFVLSVQSQWNRDNGSGFFDYNRLAVQPEWEVVRGLWRSRLLGRMGHYSYLRRPILSGPAELIWRKEDFTVEGRVSRQLGRRVSLFAEYAWERSWANRADVSYQVNSVVAGVEWTP